MQESIYDANYAWNSGDYQRAIDITYSLIRGLSKKAKLKKAPTIESFPWLFKKGAYFSFLSSLIDDHRRGSTTYLNLFMDVWMLDPSAFWISKLLRQNIRAWYTLDNKVEALLAEDVHRMQTVFKSDIASGILSCHCVRDPLVAGPCISREKLGAVPDYESWLVKEALLVLCDDPNLETTHSGWQLLAKNAPLLLLRRFCHDLFLDLPIETSLLRWNGLQLNSLDFCDEVRKLWVDMLSSTKTVPWKQLAQADSGFVVEDGFEWGQKVGKFLSVSELNGLETYDRVQGFEK